MTAVGYSLDVAVHSSAVAVCDAVINNRSDAARERMNHGDLFMQIISLSWMMSFQRQNTTELLFARMCRHRDVHHACRNLVAELHGEQ